MRKILLILLLTLVFCGCEKRIQIRNGKLVSIKTIEDLDDAAFFNFIIMSDNKGDSGANSPFFANLEKRIRQSNSQFVIGMGDHLKINWNNSFLELIQEDEWWNSNFYPNIADGENEYFGESQADWGSGGKFLDYVNPIKNAKVEIRDNGAEYYLRRRIGDFTIHLIQLHYPDEPDIDSLAFRQESKHFMTDKLRSIQKSDHDIVIVGAHSRSGFWFDLLSKEEQSVVLQKSDLVLSATTHFFERQIVEGYEKEGPLFINTGSITYPAKYSPFGYVQVHLLKHPPMLVVQYLDAEKEIAELQHKNYAFIKKINGAVVNTNFRSVRPEEDIERTVTYLPVELDRQEMNLIVNQLYRQQTNADVSLVHAPQGFPKGEIQYQHLWDIFPYNNEISALKLEKKWLESNFGINASVLKDSLLVATSYYQAVKICSYLDLPLTEIIRTGKKEIPTFEQLLQELGQDISDQRTSLIQGVASVNIYVDDFQQNYYFYHSVLGLPIVRFGEEHKCSFRLGSKKQLNLIAANRKHIQSKNTAFVLSVSSVSALIELLQKENIRILHDKPQNRGDGNYQLTFYDPAGNMLEAVGGL